MSDFSFYQSYSSWCHDPFAWRQIKSRYSINKANLRDLIAANGLVILLKLDWNRRFFSQCDLEILWVTPRNNKTPLLYYTKLCASFQIHQWIQIGVTVRKRPIWVKIDDFFRPVSLQFDVWPWKTIEHLFYATSSFVHHCVAIGEFKVTVRKRPIFFSRVTSQFDVWPWKTTGHLHYANSSFLYHFIAIGEFKLELQSGNAWFGSKSTIFLVVWPCNLTYDLEKQ